MSESKMRTPYDDYDEENFVKVITPWVTRKGRRFYHPQGKFYVFLVPRGKWKSK